MQLRTVDLRQKLAFTSKLNATLSVKPFLDFLQKSLEQQSPARLRAITTLVSTIKNFPGLTDVIDLEDVHKFEELFELIFMQTSAITDDENTTYRAFGLPFVPAFFYGSSHFYGLLKAMKENKNFKEMEINEAWFKKHNTAAIYSLILQRFYGYPPLLNVNIVQSITNPETGLSEYYRMAPDPRFIEIIPLSPLPELNISPTELSFSEGVAFEALEARLPLSMFSFNGFSVINLIDVTQEYAIDSIKNAVVQHSAITEDICYTNIEQYLQVLVKSKEAAFDLYPLFRVNGKLVLKNDSRLNSMLLEEGRRDNLSNETFITMVESYVKHPRLLLYKTIPDDYTAGFSYLSAHKKAGLKSFAVLPVFYKNKIEGILEVSTKKEGLLDERMVAKLDMVLPVLADLLINSIDAFDGALESVIKEKFTPLQPSVQWKFNEAAWNFLESKYHGTKQKIEPIVFKDVHPLYGAIDIRNSTIERNRAIVRDLQIQFAVLHETLSALKQLYNMPLIDEMIFKCNKWQKTMQGTLTSNDEINLNNLLEVEAVGFLRHFEKRNSQTDNIITRYLAAISNKDGIAYQHRQKLEESIQLINSSVSNYLDVTNLEIQESYPCYFEKFRTDGIEYDIYIGQSIAPNKPFDILYLKNIRLWQLAAMASIARLTHQLAPTLPVPLDTTQLIFINTNTIDISFRNDERKFDVEGAYNIRYQLIKKRIDKVHILGTSERLTQPGTIALIYYTAKDAEEYLFYIEYLQQQKLLTYDIEYLELEELQGVAGLKAIRIGVNYGEEALELVPAIIEQQAVISEAE